MCKNHLHNCIKAKKSRFFAVFHKKTALLRLFGFFLCELFRFAPYPSPMTHVFYRAYGNRQKNSSRNRDYHINKGKAEPQLDVIFRHCVPAGCRRAFNVSDSRFRHLYISHIHLCFLPFGFCRSKKSAGKNILCRRMIFMLFFCASFFHQNENSAKRESGCGKYHRDDRNYEKL